jgi:anti-sigma factor ChrR (cupin superfamily)
MRTYRTTSLLLVALLVVAGTAIVAAQDGQHAEAGKMLMISPDQINWQKAPASLPSGAEAIVLEGDPAAPGLFTMRLKAPAGYRIPPHTHPRVERVTVIRGTFRLGMGREFDEQRLEDLPAGSFFTMPPGMVHFAAVGDDGAEIQLNGIGPWEINYINPQDDPRRTQQ